MVYSLPASRMKPIANRDSVPQPIGIRPALLPIYSDGHHPISGVCIDLLISINGTEGIE